MAESEQLRPSQRPEFAGWTQLDFLAAILAELAAANGQASGQNADQLPAALVEYRAQLYAAMGPTVAEALAQQPG